MIRRLQSSTLFPYTTLFRSGVDGHEIIVELILVDGLALLVAYLHQRGQHVLAPRMVHAPLADHPAEGRVDGVQGLADAAVARSEEHTSELQSQFHLVCRLLL